MKHDLVTRCPRCKEKLVATRLSCDNCEMELSGDFPLSKFDYLSSDEMDFIECFLKHHGNFKALQNEKGMTYPATKKRLVEILDKLELAQPNKDEASKLTINTVKHVEIKEDDSKVIKTIKEKLNANNGRATIRLYQGDGCDIWFDENGKGLISHKIPPANQLIWEAFDAAVEVVVKNGGKAPKGKARSGAKLGSDDLPLDSVEGYIAHKVHGVKEGETAFGPGFVICAVLDWAGICNNERGYLTLNSNFELER